MAPTLREILAARNTPEPEADEAEDVEVETLWTPNTPWGNDTFLIEGKLYRRATNREHSDFGIETDYGDVSLRRLASKETSDHLTFLVRRLYKRAGVSGAFGVFRGKRSGARA